MSGCDARADGFVVGTVLPSPTSVAALGRDGHSTRDMVEAVRDGDLAKARRLLDADPALARIGDGRNLDLLTLAVARDGAGRGKRRVGGHGAKLRVRRAGAN